MSVLSFIEVLYFFTVRLYKHYKDVDGREKRRQEMIKNGGHVIKRKIKYGESFYADQCVLPKRLNIIPKELENPEDPTPITGGFIQ